MNIAGVDNQRNSSRFLSSMEGTVIGIVSHIMETSGCRIDTDFGRIIKGDRGFEFWISWPNPTVRPITSAPNAIAAIDRVD